MKKAILLAASVVISQSASFSQVIPFGLQGDTVNSIRLLDDVLYAGTRSDGVFRRALTDTGWTSLGLEGKEIMSIYPHFSDASGFSMLAGISTYYSGDETVIFGLSPSGWVPADSGIDQLRVNEIRSINGTFRPSGDHIVYAASPDSRLYKRSNLVWNEIFNQSSWVVDISPIGEIWAGGETGIFAPFVAKSTDDGASWIAMVLPYLGDDIVMSFAFDPSDPKVVYASEWQGDVVKTINAGVDWNVTGLSFGNPKLAIDPSVPTHLFCGGAEGFAFTKGILVETINAGLTWQGIALPESVRGIKDIEVVIGDSLDLYVATAGSGVYRLRQYTTGFALKVTPGWNMISIPKHVPDYRKSSMFPTSTSAAFAYDGIYRIRDTLNNGEGFWLKFSTAGMLSIASDTSILADSIDVHIGWNMIGSISKPVIVSTITSDPPGIVTSKFYNYQGSYSISDSIKPGFGYWVKVNQSGKLILSSSGAAPASNRIRIVSSSELPPAPPAELPSNPEPPTPNHFALHQNYPNPFNPTTRVSFVICSSSLVSLRVYDVLGREVAELVNEELEPGTYTRTWDATGISAGIYFYRLTAGTFDEVKKMVVAR